MPRKSILTKADPKPVALLGDVRALILAARDGVARTINTGLVLLYWQIGKRTREEVLHGKRADYGEEILPTLSAKLAPGFGDGFSARNLRRMVQLAEAFPDRDIISTLSQGSFGTGK